VFQRTFSTNIGRTTCATRVVRLRLLFYMAVKHGTEFGSQ